MSRILYSLCLLIGLSHLSFAQSIPKILKHKQFHLSEDAKYLKNRVVFKVKPEWREVYVAAMSGSTGTPFAETLQQLQLKKSYRAFPHVDAPLKSHNQIGQKMVDLTGIYKLEYEGGWTVEEAVNLILQHEGIEYAEPWYTYDLFYYPDDPRADTLTGEAEQWHLHIIKAFEAWAIQRGDSNIVIGVTDTGASFQHEDMQDNLHLNYADPINGIDDDNDGYVDNYRGWDMIGADLDSEGDNDPTFVHDHGAAVAGLFAASTDNGVGAAGVAFNCGYLPIKASSDLYPTNVSHGYEGIVYAVNHGANIVNCSWGGSVASAFGQDVVNYATINQNALIVAACGNTDSDLKLYPAAFDQVFSVANTFKTDHRYLNSTYDYTVDVSCPGAWVMGPIAHSGYARVTGTSFASPITAGAAAIVLADNPTYSPIQAAQRLRVTTDNHYSKNGNFVDRLGSGRINMLKALTDPPLPSIRKLSDSIASRTGAILFEEDDTLEIHIDWVNYLDSTHQLNIELSVISGHSAYAEVINSSLPIGSLPTLNTYSNTSNPFLVHIKPGTPYDQEIHLRLSYTDTTMDYDDYQYIEVLVNPTYVNVTENRLHTTVNSIGNFGYNDFPLNEHGLGVVFDEGDPSLYEGGFLLGNSHTNLWNNIRTESGPQETDFSINQKISITSNPPHTDFEAQAQFNVPNGMTVRQTTYANADSSQYVIVEYEIENPSATPVEDMYAGIFADWDVGSFSDNWASYDSAHQLAYAIDLEGVDTNYYGLTLLSYGQFHAFSTTFYSPFDYSDSSKYEALRNIPSDQTATVGGSNGEDIMQFISEGPFDLAANGSYTSAFAIIAGTNLDDLREAADSAREMWRCGIQQEDAVAGFSTGYATEYVRLGESIQFVPDDMYAEGWFWDFGDGIISNEQMPTHTYADTGTYTVCEIIQACGVQNLNCRTLSVIDCGRDAFEPNDFIQTAAVLPNIGIQGNAQICAEGDEDWFKFQVIGNDIHAKIRLSGLSSDLDLELFDASGNSLASSAGSGTQDELLVYNNLSTTDYYIKVSGKDSTWANDAHYRLQVQRRNTPYSVVFKENPDLQDLAQESNSRGIHVYPNPTQSIVTIESPTKGQVILYDLLGHIIQQKDILVGKNTLILSDLPDGIYLLESHTNVGIKRHRIVLDSQR